jgi:hypothetical protein
MNLKPSMRFVPLCRNEDPLLKLVREKYHAQPVAVPKEGINPLEVLVESGKDEFRGWGPLGDLVTGQPPLEDVLGRARPKLVSDVSGMWSSSVDAGVGLEILGFVLRVFGIPVPGIGAAFTSARKVSFKFSGVTERKYGAGAIGNALARRKLRRRNPANVDIAKKGWALVIDSVLSSRDFAVRVEKKRGTKIGIDYGLLNEAVSAKASASFTKIGDDVVSFQARKPAVFAFTALRLGVSQYQGFTDIQLGPPRILMRAMTARRGILYGNEFGGLDIGDITSTGGAKVIREKGGLLAIDVRDGPLVVNAAPVELRPEPTLLVPSD